MKPKGIGIVAEFTGIPTGLLLCALRPKERAQTRDKIMPTRAMRIPPDEMKRLGPTTCVLTRLMVRTCAPHALRGRNPLILSEEAAIRITDGTENPSPPGESVSLIGRNLTRARCECQIKKPASEKFPAIASPNCPPRIPVILMKIPCGAAGSVEMLDPLRLRSGQAFDCICHA